MGDLAGDIVDLEVVDALGATLAGEDIGPGRFYAAPERADDAHTRDDDAAQFHCMVPRRLRLADGLGQKGNGIAEGLDRLGSVVGNLDREFFFEGHHQLDLVEGVGTQIVDKAGLFDDLFRIDIEVLDNDLADAISDIAHILTSLFD